MKKSNLIEIHRQLGGTFQAGNNSQTPDHYDDSGSEAVHVRRSSGIIDLTGRGKLTITGKDHLKLLQGMLTNDMVKLEAGSGNHVTALTIKGRMLADIRAFKFGDFMIFDLEAGQQKVLAEHLNKFKLSYKADIKDTTDDYLHFHICGPKAAEVIKSVFNIDTTGLKEYSSKTIAFIDSEFFLIKINRTGETGFDIIIAEEHGDGLFSKLINDGKAAGLKPFGSDALNTLRIEAGIPVLGIDMDENTIPIEAGLWDALDFEKGCYIGQEVIARIKWRGRVNWHLVGFKTTDKSEITVGNKIYNDNKEIGRITSTTFSKSLNETIALGYIRREFKERGMEVLVNTGENSYLNATVCELPFINNFN